MGFVQECIDEERTLNQNAQMNEALLAAEFPGTWIAERSYLWQMGLLTADDLARKTGPFKLGLHFDRDDVSRLWQLGVLRADLIRSTRRLRRASLMLRGQDEQGRWLYTDERHGLVRDGSIVGALARTGPPHQDIVPLFHPFRYYVLYHLESALSPNLSPMVPLHGQRNYRALYAFNLRLLKRMSSSEQFSHMVDHWNDVAALAIALEPCFFERLFGRITAPVLLRVGEDDDTSSIVSGEELFELVRKQIAEHWDRVAPHIQTLGIDRLERVRADLCVDAERLSANKQINLVMRLQRGPGRLDTQGALGGAIYLHTMAELLRRTAEKQYDTALPEEDELGFGWSPPGLKRQRYGVDRLLDGDENAVNALLQDLGLSYNWYLNWYVEGTTEWSALDYVRTIVGLHGVSLINLRGKVAEGKDELIFADSLAADKRRKIYTFISIDVTCSPRWSPDDMRKSAWKKRRGLHAEEPVQRRADHWDLEARRGRTAGRRRVPRARHQRWHVLPLEGAIWRAGGESAAAPAAT